MSRMHLNRAGEHDVAGTRSVDATGASPTPGKRTLVEQEYPRGLGMSAPSRAAASAAAPDLTIQGRFGAPRNLVQRRGAGPAPDAAAIHASAQRGVATPATQLPHHATIQRAFGRHDISMIQAHVGSEAQAAARDMGATAYAMGTHVVVGGSPDLFTMAHEAAHVIQQRGGVRCHGGVGEVNDAHEQHADEVARLVTAGQSAEALLDRYTGGGAATAAPVQQLVQRKVGFEAELSVPSYGPAPGAVDDTRLTKGPDGDAPTPAIEQFLFGGLPYGENRGENEHFTLKPDHNELQDKMIPLWRKLRSMGILLAIPTTTTSNLEYVTKPIDELAVNSTQAFDQQFAAIQNHVNALFPAATTSMQAIGAPGVATFTGVPVADLQAWLGSRYGEIASLVGDFQASVKNELYLQATVGIIPSAIRDLHKAHAPARPEDAVTVPELAMVWVDRYIDQILGFDEFQNHPYIQELRNGKDQKGWLGGTTHKPARPIDYEAFTGVLHLMLMYAVGSALNQTNLFDGSSKKNSVPFLSKMSNLRSIISAAAPGLQAHRPPSDLVAYIAHMFGAIEQTKVDWWIQTAKLEDRRGVEGREATIGSTFVSDMLGGNWILPESIFGGTQVTAVGSPRSFATPDQLPPEVSQASGGQQAAQFEYRYLSARPSGDGLAAELTKVVREVRQLNLKHMPGQRGAEITHQAEHGEDNHDVILDL